MMIHPPQRLQERQHQMALNERPFYPHGDIFRQHIDLDAKYLSTEPLPIDWNPDAFCKSSTETAAPSTKNTSKQSFRPAMRRRNVIGNGPGTSLFQIHDDLLSASSSSDEEEDFLLPIERPESDATTTTKQRVNRPRQQKVHKPLPKNFKPHNYSVLIGRAKDCKEAIGNRRLKVLVDLALPKYKDAKYKMQKTIVVSSLVETIQGACGHHGAFIKFSDGQWWEVDDATAREKVGYALRDLLSDKYKSASKAKSAVRRRKSKQEQQKGRRRSSEVSMDSAASEVSKV